MEGVEKIVSKIVVIDRVNLDMDAIASVMGCAWLLDSHKEIVDGVSRILMQGASTALGGLL